MNELFKKLKEMQGNKKGKGFAIILLVEQEEMLKPDKIKEDYMDEDYDDSIDEDLEEYDEADQEDMPEASEKIGKSNGMSEIDDAKIEEFLECIKINLKKLWEK